MKPGLLITLPVEGVRVTVFGAATDEESQRKLLLLQDSGATVAHHPTFEPAALDGARLAFYLERDPAIAAAVFAECRRRNVLCWTADAPATSDFSMPAIARLGRARIAVSTGGASPALAARIRAVLEASLGDTFAHFVDALAQLRAETPTSPRRISTLRAAVDEFTLAVTTRYPTWFRP